MEIEQEYMDKLKPSLNVLRAYCTKEDISKTKRESNIRRAKIKITCECGSCVRKSYIARHKRTKKHQTYLSSLS